jgi:hypothetical protein
MLESGEDAEVTPRLLFANALHDHLHTIDIQLTLTRAGLKQCPSVA